MIENSNNNRKKRLQMKLFANMEPEEITHIAEEAIKQKQISIYQKFKSENHYRKATNGILCAKCKHIIHDSHHRNNYYKCELLGTSRSVATDIRLSYVCDKFELDKN